jgi:hypothetical protein
MRSPECDVESLNPKHENYPFSLYGDFRCPEYVMSGTGTRSRPPGVFKALLGTEIASTICGFTGGIPLTLDPSGKLLGPPLSNLNGLPIHGFLLPGLWLIFVFGVGLSATTFGLWKWKEEFLLSARKELRDDTAFVFSS